MCHHYSFQDKKSKYQKAHSELFSILIKRWICMSNGERSMFSLTATSLETVIPMEEQGGRVRQASASLDHKSKCPGHSTCWLHSCLLHFSSTFFKKETCRPEGENKAAWKLKKKKKHLGFYTYCFLCLDSFSNQTSV